jgi:co-chaperonin GroES (HSP10)
MDFQGSLIPLEVQVGDMVYIQNHGQFEIEGVYFKGEDCMVASINDVMAYFRDSEFQPLGSLIEIEKIEVDEQEDNGIFMTKTFKYPSNVGIVKKVGLGWNTPSGNKIPFQVKEGDLVVYNPFAERTLNMEPMSEGKRYLVSHGDIFGVVAK